MKGTYNMPLAKSKFLLQQAVQRCAALKFRYTAMEYDGTWPWCGDQFHRDGGLDVNCQAASARLVLTEIELYQSVVNFN